MKDRDRLSRSEEDVTLREERIDSYLDSEDQTICSTVGKVAEPQDIGKTEGPEPVGQIGAAALSFIRPNGNLGRAIPSSTVARACIRGRCIR